LEQVVGWVPVVLEYGAVVFPILWNLYRLGLLVSR
jgi:hypothetical protein